MSLHNQFNVFLALIQCCCSLEFLGLRLKEIVKLFLFVLDRQLNLLVWITNKSIYLLHGSSYLLSRVKDIVQLLFIFIIMLKVFIWELVCSILNLTCSLCWYRNLWLISNHLFLSCWYLVDRWFGIRLVFFLVLLNPIIDFSLSNLLDEIIHVLINNKVTLSFGHASIGAFKHDPIVLIQLEMNELCN